MQIKWNLLNVGLKTIMRIVSTILFMRWIDPDNYGKFTIIVIVIEGFYTIIERGFTGSIIQSKDFRVGQGYFLIRQNIKTALILYLVFISLSYFIWRLEFVYLLIIGISLIFYALTIVPRAVFIKKENFKFIAIVEIVSLFLSICISIPIAFSGNGFIALVFYYVINSLLLSLFYAVDFFKNNKEKKSIPIDFKGYHTSILANNSVLYLAKYLDQILISSLFGMTVQGIYNRSLMLVSSTAIIGSSALSEVLLPQLSAIKLNEKRNKYFQTIRLTLFFVIPFLFILYAAIGFIIPIVGDKWLSIYEYSFYIVLATLPMTFNYLFGALLISSGQKKLIYEGMILKRIASIGAILIGSFWGIIGLLIGKIISECLTFIINLSQTKRILQIGIFEQLKEFRLGLVVLIYCLVATSLLKPNLLYMLIIILGTVITYWVFDRPIFKRIQSITKNLSKMN